MPRDFRYITRSISEVLILVMEMAEEEIKLLGVWASPFSQRVEAVLKLKGLKFQLIEEDLYNKSKLLLQSNPVHKKIPVLIHNGNPIAESLIIMEYIDETWGNNSIMPEDPYDRAMARFWAKFVDEKVLPTAWKAYLMKDKEQEDGIGEFCQQLKLLEGELGEKEYFGGGSMGFADIAVFFLLYFFGILQEVKEAELMTDAKFPVLFKWMEKVRGSNDAVEQSVPPREKHVAFIRDRIAAGVSATK